MSLISVSSYNSSFLKGDDFDTHMAEIVHYVPLMFIVMNHLLHFLT